VSASSPFSSISTIFNFDFEANVRLRGYARAMGRRSGAARGQECEHELDRAMAKTHTPLSCLIFLSDLLL
jgi:hypothetical protein